MVHDFIGKAVYKAPPGLTAEEVAKGDWLDSISLQALASKDDLIDGAVVLIPSEIFGVFWVGTVERLGGTGPMYFHSINRETVGPLVWGADSRQIWSCVGFLDAGSVKRVRVAEPAP